MRPLLAVLLPALLLAAAPPAPVNLIIKSITSTEIELQWMEPIDPPRSLIDSGSSIRQNIPRIPEYTSINDDDKPKHYHAQNLSSEKERLRRRRKRRRDLNTTTEDFELANTESETAKNARMMEDKTTSKPKFPFGLNYALNYERGPNGGSPNKWAGENITIEPLEFQNVILSYKNHTRKGGGVKYRLKGLDSFAYYRMWVQAFYTNFSEYPGKPPESQLSPISSYVVGLTDVPPPSPPIIVNLTCTQPPGNLYLKFLPPKHFARRINMYTINYKMMDSPDYRVNSVSHNVSLAYDHLETELNLPDIEIDDDNRTTYEVTIYAATESVVNKGILINGTSTEPYQVIMTRDCVAVPLEGIEGAEGAGLGSNFMTQTSPTSVLVYVLLAIFIIAITLVPIIFLQRWGCTNIFKKCFPMSYLFLDEGGAMGGNDGCGEAGLLTKSELQQNSGEMKLLVFNSSANPAQLEQLGQLLYWGKGENGGNGENFKEQLWDSLHPPVKAENFFAHTMSLHVDGDIGFSKEYELIQSKSSLLGHTSHHSQHPENRHKNRYLNITAYDHSRVCLLPSSSCLCEAGREHRKSCMSKPNPQSDSPSHCDYVNANFIDGIVSEIDADLAKFIIDENKRRSANQKLKNEGATASQTAPAQSDSWITVDESQRPHVQVCPKPAFSNLDTNPFAQDGTAALKNKLSLDLDKKEDRKVLSPGSEILANTCRLSINLDRKEEKPDDTKSEKSIKETKSKKRSTSADTKDIVIDKKNTSRGHSKNSSVVVTSGDNPTSSNLPKIEGAFLNIEFSGIVDSEREFQKAKELERSNEISKLQKEAAEETLDDLDNLYIQIDNESYRINSSWLLDRRRYIGTQGPTPGTLPAFWRMVWDHKVVVIVMITNLIERGRRKCDMYWPKEGTETYGIVQVSTLKEDVMATYTVRTFQITNTKLNLSRSVLQYHYTVWPDHGTPEHPLAVLRFREAARKAAPPQAGSILVHCSAGVGRTGTYVVMDAMLNHLRLTGYLNVYGFLCHVRSQRNFLVQTEEQYVFIHDALLEAIQSGDTEVPIENSKNYLKTLLEPFPKGYVQDTLQNRCGLYGPPPTNVKANGEPFESNVGNDLKRINSEECDFAMWNNVDDSNDKTLDECRNDIVGVALQDAKANLNNLDMNGDKNHVNGDVGDFDESLHVNNLEKGDHNDISPELIIDDKDNRKIIDFEDGNVYNKNILNVKDVADNVSINSINLAKSDNSTSYEKLNGIAKASEESKASSVSNEEVEISSNENNSNVITNNNSKAVDRNSGVPLNSDHTNTITSSISSDTNNLNNGNFKDKLNNYSPCLPPSNQDTVDGYKKGKNYRIRNDDNYELLNGSGRPGGFNVSSECFAGSHQFSYQKRNVNTKHPKNLLEHQFRLITSFEPSKFHIVNACKQVNASKNRRNAVLPIESGRVHLIPKPGIDGSDYINATWLQGHRSLREYVITQHPLPNTVPDLYRLLWDHSCQILVVLTDCNEDTECSPFWPTEKDPEITTANYSIRYLSEEKYIAKRLSQCDLNKQSQGDDNSIQITPLQSPTSSSSSKGFPLKSSKSSQRVSPVSSCLGEPENQSPKKLDDDGSNVEEKSDEFYKQPGDKQDEERLIPKTDEVPSLEFTEENDELKKLNNETKSDGYYFDKSELRIETMIDKDVKPGKLSPKKLPNGEPLTPNEDLQRKPQKSPSKLSLKSLKLSSPILKSPSRFKFDFGSKSKPDEAPDRKSPTIVEVPTFDPKFTAVPFTHPNQLREGLEDVGIDCVITTTQLSINSLQDDYELRVKLVECPKWLADLDYDENSDTDDDSEDEEYEMESKVLDYVIDQRLRAYKGALALPEFILKCQDESKNSPVVIVDKLGGARAVGLCTLTSTLRRQLRDVYSLAKLHHGRRAGAWRRPGDIRALYEALAAYEHPPTSAGSPTEV